MRDCAERGRDRRQGRPPWQRRRSRPRTTRHRGIVLLPRGRVRLYFEPIAPVAQRHGAAKRADHCHFERVLSRSSAAMDACTLAASGHSDGASHCTVRPSASGVWAHVEVDQTTTEVITSAAMSREYTGGIGETMSDGCPGRQSNSRPPPWVWGFSLPSGSVRTTPTRYFPNKTALPKQNGRRVVRSAAAIRSDCVIGRGQRPRRDPVTLRKAPWHRPSRHGRWRRCRFLVHDQRERRHARDIDRHRHCGAVPEQHRCWCRATPRRRRQRRRFRIALRTAPSLKFTSSSTPTKARNLEQCPPRSKEMLE